MESSHNYLILSELHLSEGRDPATGEIHPLEDFRHDEDFAEFIAYHISLSLDPNAKAYYQKPWKLILNGDTFNFLQVVSLPASSDELMAVKGVRNSAELSQNELNFGLGSSLSEAVWKLNKVAAGHPQFFQALAWFVAQNDNEVVFMKGDTDIELVWPEVQARIAQLLVNAFAGWRLRVAKGNVETPLFDHHLLPEKLGFTQVQTAVSFPPYYYYEPKIFYIEHGCQYDPSSAFTDFVSPFVPGNPDIIQYPIGSLFRRYFFNLVEETHPFAGKMKPRARYFFWLIRSSPSTFVQFVTNFLPQYLRARRRLTMKTRGTSSERRTSSQNGFEENLAEIQHQTQATVQQMGKWLSRRLTCSFFPFAVSVILLLYGIRLLAVGSYLSMVIAFTLTGLFAFISLYLFQPQSLWEANLYLFQAACYIARLLKSNMDAEFSPVPYLVFGHDHNASVRPIPSMSGDELYRHWYINHWC